MLQVSDFRETKVYQEAFEEGVEKGIERGIERGIEKGLEKGIEKGRDLERELLARRLLDEKFTPKKIAELTGLTLAAIKRLKKTQGK